jgi:hypothetical protein
MSIINAVALSAAGDDGYRIERSLRFNSPDTAYLNRTPASAGNRKTWTWSGWVKRSTLAEGFLFAAGTSNALRFGIIFNAQGNQEITIVATQGGSNVLNLITTPVYRDVSAWYHLVFAVDTTQATSTNRAKLYINGAQVTALATATYPAQNTDLEVNTTNPHVHGCRGTYTVDSLFAGYLTEVNFIDGQALTPSSFGETNPVTGVWGPKRYAGTYGTNGFYLKFADNSNTTAATLGKDSSGNGNNWTPNNFSVTAGVGNDSMIDVPTPYADGGNGRGNYCTLNPLATNTVGVGTLSNGNLDFNIPNTFTVYGSVPMKSGKWYWEAVATGSNAVGVGIKQTNVLDRYSNTIYYMGNSLASGEKYINGTGSAYGAVWSVGDVIGVAVDVDGGTVTFYKNNVSQGTIALSLASITELVPSFVSGAGVTFAGSVNFGQRAFAYTPPTGFLALNTQNLPEPSIKKPSSYFNTVLYTGNGGSQSITGVGFNPDLVWCKGRSFAYHGALVDQVRGATKYLYSSLTVAEETQTVALSSFDSDGFSLNGSFGNVNNSGTTYVAWCWDESATPGFDIVTYTGDGNTGRTVSHNLGVKPSMVMVKLRAGGTEGWPVWHKSLSSESYFLRLNETSSTYTAFTNRWTAFSSTTITLGNNSETNGNTNTYVAYLWSEVAGFSKFGSYTGNGSADGPFVHCGFRPRFILFKNTTAYNWQILDTARADYNQGTVTLFPNLSNADNTTATQYDILSNGFKIRTSDAGSNGSGNSIIFAAFAESPQKYSLAR